MSVFTLLTNEMSDVYKSARDERNWYTWSGDLDRLERLVRELETLLENQKLTLTQQTRELYDPLIEAEEDDAKRNSLKLERHNEIEYIEDHGITVEATEKNMALTHTGQPEDVFGEMDRRALKSLTIIVGRPHMVGRFNATVRMVQPRGIELEASGGPEWVRSAISTMSDVIKSDVPWWSFLRNDWGGAAVALTAYYNAMLLWPFPAIEQAVSEGSLNLNADNLWIVFALLSGMFVYPTSNWAIRRILPAFEVTAPGEQGRGRTAIGVAGLIILALLPSLLFG